MQPALAYAGVEQRGLKPRVAANQQQKVRLLYPGYARVQEIVGAQVRAARACTEDDIGKPQEFLLNYQGTDSVVNRKFERK